jgi:hypothetical protein
MQDYSKYPYGGLLIYIETMCKQRGEERDYITYLFSMERAESIESESQGQVLDSLKDSPIQRSATH